MDPNIGAFAAGWCSLQLFLGLEALSDFIIRSVQAPEEFYAGVSISLWFCVYERILSHSSWYGAAGLGL